MTKRPFFSLSKPRLLYEALTGVPPEPRKIRAPESKTLLVNAPKTKKAPLIAFGDMVVSGQEIKVYEDMDDRIVAPFSGKVTSVMPFTGDMGQVMTCITITKTDAAPKKSKKDEAKEETKEVAKKVQTFDSVSGNLTLDKAAAFLSGIPGKPPFEAFGGKKAITSIIIRGYDSDLFIVSNQYALKKKKESISKGVAFLKKLTGVNQIILAVTENQVGEASGTGADVKSISNVYPAGNPFVMIKTLLGKTVPAGKTPEDIGVTVFSAEAVAALGEAVETGLIPSGKLVTIINKNGDRLFAEVEVGTPLGDVLKEMDVPLKDKDRIIFGGPMTGVAVYSLDFPVLPDTDAIIVQDGGNLNHISDTPCINCGECVRVCPANVPINMLVRFLEAGQYEDGESMYDLQSCVECGLCSFVCVSRIPIFQYIRLAKYELARLETAEETNE